MKKRKILAQALLFEDEKPTFSRVKELFDAAKAYENEHGVYMIEGKRGKKVVIENSETFFEFLSEISKANIKNFQAIKNYFQTTSRKENIEFTGDSKSNYVKVFDNVVLIKKVGEDPQLYTKDRLYKIDNIEKFVAVENGETFLNIDTKSHNFDANYFVYISGYCNRLTREFIKTKEVEFFLDFDIEGMNIYESFVVKKKSFHMPKELERYFSTSNLNSKELYLRQRGRMKKHYCEELKMLVFLIDKYATVVEQEIVYEA